MNSELTPITEASRMLAEARTIPELKHVRDVAITAKTWAQARGKGIESENLAAEYILRAERAIGKALRSMIESGTLARRGDWKERDPEQGRGGENKNLPSKQVLHLADLGISDKESYKFQLVGLLTDDTFESILRHAQSARERIAKVDFYRAAKQPTKDASPETPFDKGFETFRAGAYNLLGWRIGDDAKGVATRNAFLSLPDDDLRQVAELLKALVVAYQEAKQGRG